MTEPLAYLNGDFIPASQLVVSTEDLGFAQGVSISERLRTFRGQLFRLDEHLERLANSLRIVDLQPGLSIARIGELADELVSRNRHLLTEGDDLGVSLFITPGVPALQQPTVGMRVYPLTVRPMDVLPRPRPVAHGNGRATGARVVLAGGTQVSQPHALLPGRPPGPRYRSRFARRAARPGRLRVRSVDGQYPVLSPQGRTGVAAAREDPARGQPLRAGRAGCGTGHRRSISASSSWQELAAADEILMCSTSPCVWPVTRLNGQPLEPGARGPIYQQILRAWSELVGVDIAAQARRFGFRT